MSEGTPEVALVETAPARSRWRRLTDALALAGMALVPRLGRVERLYRLLGARNSLGRRTLYMNLGYWRDDPPDLDAAGDALAALVAETAGLGPEDEVLDAGCGFADQDILWARRWKPRRIHGLNLSAEQLEVARVRVREAGLDEDGRITLARADATRTGLPDASFDVVVGVESAFHFRTRDDFLREAHRLLRPGGRVALADLAGVAGPLALRDRMVERVGRSFWQIPRENLVPAPEYAERLRAAGFEAVRVESIWTDVHPRFVQFARRRLHDPDVVRRLNPFFRRMLLASVNARERLSPNAMDYVLVYGERGPA